MSDTNRSDTATVPTTPTGKRQWDKPHMGDWRGAPISHADILAIEREAREPTDEGTWFTVDSLAAAMPATVMAVDSRIAEDGSYEEVVLSAEDLAAALVKEARLMPSEDKVAKVAKVARSEPDTSGPIKPTPHEHVYTWTDTSGNAAGAPPIGTPCAGCGHEYTGVEARSRKG